MNKKNSRLMEYYYQDLSTNSYIGSAQRYFTLLDSGTSEHHINLKLNCSHREPPSFPLMNELGEKKYSMGTEILFTAAINDCQIADSSPC